MKKRDKIIILLMIQLGFIFKGIEKRGVIVIGGEYFIVSTYLLVSYLYKDIKQFLKEEGWV